MTISISKQGIVSSFKLALRVLFIAWALLGGAAGFQLWLRPTGLTFGKTGARVTRAAAIDVLIMNEVDRQKAK